MSDASPTEPGGDELLDRLDVIEGQPLADRAEAYAQLHEELVRRLDAADPHDG
jgi:hypothetical protein